MGRLLHGHFCSLRYYLWLQPVLVQYEKENDIRASLQTDAKEQRASERDRAGDSIEHRPKIQPVCV